MVVLIQRFDSETNEPTQLGRLHNGEILATHTDGFEDDIAHMRDVAEREPTYSRSAGGSHREIEQRKSRVFGRPPVSVKDELSLIRRFKPPYGIYGSIPSPDRDSERLLEIDATETISPPHRPVSLASAEFRHYHDPYDEEKPAYLLCIARDGTGFFQEVNDQTPFRDVYAFTVPESIRRDLLDICYSNRLFSLDHTHIREGEPEFRPSIATGVRICGTEKWVYNYTQSPPESLKMIEEAVTTACGVDLWLDPTPSELLDLLESEADRASVALAVLHTAIEENSATDFDPDRCLDAVRPYLSASSPLTRRHAAAIAAETIRTSSASVADVIDLVAPLLRDDDDRVRAHAGEILKVRGILYDSDVLADLLQQDDLNLREGVIEQLHRTAEESSVGLHESTTLLAKELQSDRGSIRKTAVEALTEIIDAGDSVDEAVRSALVSGLDDSDKRVRRNCAKSLARLEAADALIAHLETAEPEKQTSTLVGIETLAADDPETVLDALAVLDDILEEGPTAGRKRAAQVLATTATAYPDQLFLLLSRCSSLTADTSDSIRESGYQIIETTVRDEPDMFPFVRSDVETGFEDSSKSVREHAFTTALVAGHDALVLDALQHEQSSVRASAATVLESLGEEQPDRFHDQLPAFLAALDDDDVRSSLVSLVDVLVTSSDETADDVSLLVDALETGCPKTRQALVPILDEIADEQPATITPHRHRLIELLDDADTDTRVYLLSCLAAVAEHEPAALSEHTEGIVEHFDDEEYDTRDAAARCGAALCSVTELETLVRDGTEQERHTAWWALERIAQDDPERVCACLPLAEQQLEAITGEEVSQIERRATELVEHVADPMPERVVPLVPALTSALGARGRFTRRAACNALAAVGQEDTTALIDAVPSLVPLLDDQFDDVTNAALTVVRLVSESYPSEIRPAVPQLVEMVDSDECPVEVLVTLGNVADEFPDAAYSAIGTCLDKLSADNTRVQNNALALLADLATEYPDDLIDVSDTYIALLESDDQRVKYNAVSIIARLAKTHPDSFVDAEQALLECLRADHAPTRANACWTVGRLGFDAAEPRLEYLRQTDPDDSVRAGAIAALSLLSLSTCPYCDEQQEPHAVSLRVVFPEQVEWTCPDCNQTITSLIEDE